MSGPSSISQQANVPDVLRDHRDRLRAVEAPSPGRWTYVTPISPATTPPDLVPTDTGPPFRSSWTNVAGSEAVSFRIHPATRVAMRGTIQGGSIPSIVFTLPAGYRPALVHPILFPSSDGLSVFTGRIDPNGDVWILGQIS